ncbi:MAG: hypothetical protein ABIF11_02995 [Nitrospirota bacterium]
MKINGGITILFDKEGIDIEVHNDDAIKIVNELVDRDNSEGGASERKRK